MKVTLEVLKESYSRLGNVWKVAEETGLCGQSVWERLKRYNLLNEIRRFTLKEDQKIRNLYENGFSCGEGCLDDLCKELGRDKPNIVRYARKLGLTLAKRKKGNTLKKKIGKNSKNWLKNNPHPRGMLGKTHSEENKKELAMRVTKWFAEATQERKNLRNSKALKTKLERYGTVAPQLENYKTSWKQGWREIGGKRKYFRSRWEANYARYLEYQKSQGWIKDWFHEPETFWFPNVKRGAITYLPDFKVINLDDSHFWVEVKGYMDSRSKTKLKRFKKNFPSESLTVIDGKWFSKNATNLSILIKDWESHSRKKHDLGAFVEIAKI